jgi:hypothetical protein
MSRKNLRTHPQRCACLKSDGEQCTRRAWTIIPNVTSGDGHSYTYGREVPMCAQHNCMFWRRRENDPFWRMPLIHNGFVGCYNKYGFGSIVLAEETINWHGVVQGLTIPRYWAYNEDQKTSYRERQVRGVFKIPQDSVRI